MCIISDEDSKESSHAFEVGAKQVLFSQLDSTYKPDIFSRVAK